MKSILRFLSQAWRPAIVILTLGFIAYVLYFHQLGSLVPGYASAEQRTYHDTVSIQDVFHDPLNAPYKILLLILNSITSGGLLDTRITSAIFGIIAVIIFFCITRAWFGFRVGFLGTLLFATSAGFLHSTRLGTPQILQMGILILLGTIVWHRRSPKWHPWLTYLVVAAFAGLLYVPGMVWLELVISALIYKRIFRHWKRSTNIHRAIWGALAGLVTAPLIVGIILKPSLFLPWLGLPTDLSSMADLPMNLLHTVLALGVRSDGSALTWLSHVPLLNVIELVLGAIGVYYYIYLERSARSIILATACVIGIVLISFGGSMSMASIIPVLYLMIAGGLNHFLGEWLSVFPRNPIARGFGVGIICLMLSFSVFYHIRSYFVAWPHNSQTKQVYHLQSDN